MLSYFIPIIRNYAQPYSRVTTYKFSKFESQLSFGTNTSSLFKLSLRTLSFGIYRPRPARGDGNNKNYLYKWPRITRRHKFLLAQWELLQKIKGQRFLELCFCFIFKSIGYWWFPIRWEAGCGTDFSSWISSFPSRGGSYNGAKTSKLDQVI